MCIICCKHCRAKNELIPDQILTCKVSAEQPTIFIKYHSIAIFQFDDASAVFFRLGRMIIIL